MQDSKLVSMANQMVTFFGVYPEEEAAASLRDHITMFWTPAMRQALALRIQTNPAGVEPLVLRAFSPQAAMAEDGGPTAKLTEGPGDLGELASDAG
jgi:formate dehydrogenase subunit delta